jgi:hypothetical protein
MIVGSVGPSRDRAIKLTGACPKPKQDENDPEDEHRNAAVSSDEALHAEEGGDATDPEQEVRPPPTAAHVSA